MKTATQHINNDKENTFKRIRNAVVNFTSFLFVGVVSFTMVISVLYIALIINAELMVSGVSQVLFG